MAEKPVVMMTAAEAARLELAEAMRELKANPMDETVPGGEYENAAGEMVNAHGHLLSSKEAKAERAAAEDVADAEPEPVARRGASKGRR